MARPLALVTGASAGIGLAFAELLAKDGYDLLVVARRKDRLEALAQKLAKDHDAKVEVLAADLASDAGIRAAAARAAATTPDLIVNNAGFGGYRPFVEVDPDVIDQLMSVHMRAVAQVTRAALPGMVKRGSGGVINVASLLAFSGSLPPGQGMPARVVYAGAKAFLVAFTQALAGELAAAQSKVRVQVCLPGIVATEFHTVQGMDLSRLTRMSPEDIARASLAGLATGEVVCIPALEDAAAVDRLTEAQRALMGNAQKSTIASRYG